MDNDARASARALAFGITREECTLLCCSAMWYEQEEQAMEHILRKSVESRRAYEQRRKTLAFGVILALSVAAALAFVLIG